jgi:hypothetical protein
MDVGDDNSGRRSRRPPTLDRYAHARPKIDQQRPDPGRTGLPGHTMPHGARPPGTGKADCESRPYQCTHDQTPRTLAAERQPEAFQRFTPTQSRESDPGSQVVSGCESDRGCYIGRSGDSSAGHKSCPRRAAARQRPAAVAFASRETSQARAYLGLPKLGPSSKGGDPVSHCLSPRSPASVSWILASVGVQDV